MSSPFLKVKSQKFPSITVQRLDLLLSIFHSPGLSIFLQELLLSQPQSCQFEHINHPSLQEVAEGRSLMNMKRLLRELS